MPQLGRAQVQFHHFADQGNAAGTEAQLGQALPGHRSAKFGVAEETDAAVGVDAAGLGFGDVVEQGGQFQQGAAAGAAIRWRGEVGGRCRRPGGHGVDGGMLVAAGNLFGVVDGVEQVLPNIPIVVGGGLADAFGQGQFRDDAAKQIQPIQDFQLGTGLVGGEDPQQLIAAAFRGNPFQQGGIIADLPGGFRFQAELQLAGQADSAQQAAGVVAKDFGMEGADPLLG